MTSSSCGSKTPPKADAAATTLDLYHDSDRYEFKRPDDLQDFEYVYYHGEVDHFKHSDEKAVDV